MKRSVSLLPLCLFIFLLCGCQNASSDRPDFRSVAATDKPVIDDQGVLIDYTDTRFENTDTVYGGADASHEGADAVHGDTTLVFIHGWCINKGYWSDQVAYFGKRYRVITLDLPGFGLSGNNRNEWTSQAYGRDVDTVMSKLNLSHVILIGHSMAGDIILEAALHARDRVIALIGIDNFKSIGGTPDAQAKEDYASAIRELKQHFRKVTIDYFTQSLFYKTTDSVVRRRVLNDVMHADSAVAIACQAQPDYNEVAALNALKMPLHVISSDVTPNDTASFRAAGIPLEVRYIHATGHFPMIEKPAEFNALLEETIADIGRGRH